MQTLKKEGKSLSHIIVTYIDGGHISAINKFLEENISTSIVPVKNIWQNAYRLIQPLAKASPVLEALGGNPLDSFPIKPYLKEEKIGERNISAGQGVFSGWFDIEGWLPME